MPQLFLKRCFRVIQVGNIYIYILWKSMNIFSLGVEWSTYLQCLAPKMVKWLDPYGSTVRYEVMKLFTLYRVSIEDSNGWYWISMSTPLLERRQCWGTTILPRAGYRLGTYRTVDIFNFSLIADSAQTEYCTTFHCSSVCSCVRVSQAWHLTFLTYIKA